MKPPYTRPLAAGKIRIAGITLKWLRLDREANFTRAEKLIREATAAGANICATSECFLDGYMAEENTIPQWMSHDMAEPVPDGPYGRRLAALAKELGICLVAGMTEKEGELLYNAAVIFGPEGSHLGTYRKEYLAPYDQHRCTPGTGPSAFDTPFGRIGLRICFDRSKPEAVAATCEEGADFVILVSGGLYGEQNNQVVRSRALENGKTMVLTHPVHFYVVDGDGEVLADEQFGGRGEWPLPDNHRYHNISVHGTERGMVISTEEIGGELDVNGVGYCDLDLSQSRKSGRMT
jgi:predicted amidohydrolase